MCNVSFDLTYNILYGILVLDTFGYLCLVAD